MKIRSFVIIVLVFVLTGGAVSISKASAQTDITREFKAGAAASNITPSLDERIVGG